MIYWISAERFATLLLGGKNADKKKRPKGLFFFLKINLSAEGTEQGSSASAAASGRAGKTVAHTRHLAVAGLVPGNAVAGGGFSLIVRSRHLLCGILRRIKHSRSPRLGGAVGGVTGTRSGKRFSRTPTHRGSRT
ncbi:MAG: hypothetical protein JXR89_01800, partial [Deltaproteobacteria bacterium]|nr:hypothetical protein [Deltaproteobacteria bacterium]